MIQEYRVLLFCPKYETDNPYYCSNTRLHHLTAVTQDARRDYGARLLRLGGGHRTPLSHNCEAELAFPSAETGGRRAVEQALALLTAGTPVQYQILD